MKIFIEFIVLRFLSIAELDITFLSDLFLSEDRKLSGNKSEINYKDGIISSLKIIFAIVGIFICFKSFLGMEVSEWESYFLRLLIQQDFIFKIVKYFSKRKKD